MDKSIVSAKLVIFMIIMGGLVNAPDSLAARLLWSDRGRCGVEYYGWGFAITLPENARVTRQSPADYELYCFTLSDEDMPFLCAAATDNPDTDVRESSTVERRRSIKRKVTAWSTRSFSPEGLASREALIRLPRRKAFPMYVHFWYRDLSPERRRMADLIVESLRVSTRQEK